MRKYLVQLVLAMLAASQAVAGNLLEWRDAGAGPYHGGVITSCGSPKVVDFIVTYAHNQAVNSTTTPSPSCPGGFGSNPYRITFVLFRNGASVGTWGFQSSSCWGRHVFNSISAAPGNYHVQYRFERRKLFGGWSTYESGDTAMTSANKAPAVPAFSINGQAIPSSGAINVGIGSAIIMNAASTQCATTYWVGVHESDLNWNRTFKYEWGKWFTGAPPNNISLQQLATTYSQPPDWAGTNPLQQQTPLIAGFLDSPANTVVRHYRVELCTSEPSWVCKMALLKVNY
jgi:hypothetical protein